MWWNCLHFPSTPIRTRFKPLLAWIRRKVLIALVFVAESNTIWVIDEFLHLPVVLKVKKISRKFSIFVSKLYSKLLKKKCLRKFCWSRYYHSSNYSYRHHFRLKVATTLQKFDSVFNAYKIVVRKTNHSIDKWCSGSVRSFYMVKTSYVVNTQLNASKFFYNNTYHQVLTDCIACVLNQFR